jgi:hypothetical protein
MTATVWGYTQVHNAWPLAGLAIIHHLNSVADVVVVADHASTDETREALHSLKKIYGSRLIIINIPPSDFHQAPLANVILGSLPIAPGDWVFAFDGDEFLVAQGDIRKTLNDVPSGISCLVIPVSNHLSNFYFDSRNINDFRKLGFRKSALRDIDAEGFYNMIDNVESLKNSYFDYPFEDKVVVKWREGLEWTFGAHAIRGVKPSEVSQLPDDALYLAHFPMLEWSHVIKRASQGQFFIEQGLGRHSGWQSQAVARLREAGRLEAFWELNSVSDDPNLIDSQLIFNETVNRALNNAVDTYIAPRNDQQLPEHLESSLIKFQESFNPFGAILEALSIAQRNLQVIEESAWWSLRDKLKSIFRKIRPSA